MINLLGRDQSTHQWPDADPFPAFCDGRILFQQKLDRFTPIYLEQLGKAALMDRLETKYIFHRDQILDSLPELETKYRILEIGGQRICSYRTVYYDTDDFLFFQQHQNGSGQRWKIRQRTYLDTQVNFLEVKFKDNRKRTRKSRVQANFDLDRILQNEKDFLSTNGPLYQPELSPKLEVRYTRTTLVNNNGLERVTLDNELLFSNGIISCNLAGLMIAEIKQGFFKPTSPSISQLKKAGVRPSPFSKYCIGISLINQEIKHNRFKPILHHVRNLLGGEIKYERAQ